MMGRGAMHTTPFPELKRPTTYQEQVLILKNRGLIITDDDFAACVLRNINYYRFSAYLLPFRVPGSDRYEPGTTFDRVYAIYEFDGRFRSILMSAIEPIEVMLRTRIAYYHAHRYGAAGYEKSESFSDATLHEDFMKEFSDVVQKNRRTLFVRHHIEHYGARFPIWVAVELFSLGMLSKFFANLKPDDRKRISRELGLGPHHLRSWLVCLAYLRNCCAHYSRLYDQRLAFLPRLPKGCPISGSARAFDIIYVMSFMYPNRAKWINAVVIPLQALIAQYEEDVEVSRIGFPANWFELLSGTQFR